MKPVLKWVGGKAQLLSELRKHVTLDPGETYFEPFLGGGALFFDLQPPVAYLSDVNPHLVNFYIQVRDHLPEFMQELTYYENLRVNKKTTDRDLCIRARNDFNEGATKSPALWSDVQKLEMAVWFWLINKLGFNGLWRVNRKGLCNVPPGKSAARVDIMRETDLYLASVALQGINITCADYFIALEKAHPQLGDVVYFDPPYIPASATSDFTGYTADGFNVNAQKALAIFARNLVERGVRVILSNSDTDLTREIYRNMVIDGLPAFTRHEVQARRAINCKGTKRGAVGELIIVGRMP